MSQTPEDIELKHVVLIVDDEAAIRVFMTNYLEDCGFVAIPVDCGDAAVLVLQSKTVIDLVFSDVRMPGAMDGFALARWMEKHRPEVPIILASGDIGKMNAAQGLCGFEFMQKPFDVRQAATRIRQRIDASKGRSLN